MRWLALLACCLPTYAAVLVPRASAPPVVDGSLADPVWRSAVDLGGFTAPGATTPATKPISAGAAFDEQSLYLGVRLTEPKPAKLKAVAAAGSDQVWQDDCLEIWVRTGGSPLDYDQFILNSAGVTQTVRQRRTLETPLPLRFDSAVRVGDAGWVVEVAIPWTTLGLERPGRGDRLGLKLGREDYTSGEMVLSTWPAGSGYGAQGKFADLYLESDNLLSNPALRRDEVGQVPGWSFSEAGADAARFTAIELDGQPAVRMESPGRYMIAEQGVRLRPHSPYELSMTVQGASPIYLRARCVMAAGDVSKPSDATYRPGENPAQPSRIAVRFETGFDGQALIILGVVEGWGTETSLLSDLTLRSIALTDVRGPAIEVGEGRTTITKLRVDDCRLTRGFCGAPVDGTVNSRGWDAGRWEYGMYPAGAGVGYDWGHNEGVHIELADEAGFDALQIRGGIKASVYGDGARFDQPAGAPLLHEFGGGTNTSRAVFEQRVITGKVSFFGLDDGYLADVSFFRVTRAPAEPLARLPFRADTAAGELTARLNQNYRVESRALLSDGEVRLPADEAVHWISRPLAADLPLAAVRLAATIRRGPTTLPVRITVHDPIDPRLELFVADTAWQPNIDLVLDFPAQIVPAGKRLWLTLESVVEVDLTGVEVGLVTAPRAELMPEALAYRKLLMRTFFSAASESRQWGTIGAKTDFEEWAAKNPWGDQVRQVQEAIEHALWLDPNDALAREYRDWVWRARAPVTITPVIDEVPGAPEWAVLAHQNWLQARAVADWWTTHRATPNGELGGRIGDDSDMYQNWADLPLFESDGVGARVKELGAALTEFAVADTLTDGLNRRTMDPLHAYEEGVNQLALMNLWFYGDPVALERSMENARNTVALTVLKPNGRRFFKNQDLGAEDLTIDRPLGIDGHAHPLMWHPSLEVAWYNGNPTSLGWITEWADTWLEFQRPEAYATSIEVSTEQVTESEKQAIRGGYGTQAQVMVMLYQLTGDLKYLRPMLDEFATEGQSRVGAETLPDYGELLPEGTLAPEHLATNIWTRYRATGDKSGILDKLRTDIGELQRFENMYTTAEVFTDRVFLYPLESASLAYLGGMWTRNRFARDHAVSWSGFGTEYAALVADNRRDAFKVLLYNFVAEERDGEARVWRLEHGRYRLTFGPDADGDDQMDAVTRDEILELRRGDSFAVALPPQQAMVLELTQIEALDDLRQRGDLALSVDDLGGNAVRGKIHNLGAAGTPATVVRLVGRDGTVYGEAPIPPLEAPLDLRPRTAEFELELNLPRNHVWPTLVVDPDDRILEIDERNNRFWPN